MQITFSGSLRRVALAILALSLAVLTAAPEALGAPGHVLAGSVSVPATGGLAVNRASGKVYVADSNGISEISSGTPIAFVTGGSFSNMAVDSSSGVVYAVNGASFPASLERYAADGTPLGALDGSSLPFFNPNGVAVDPATGDVYVANTDPNFVLPGVIDVFDDTGAFQTEIAGPPEAPFSFPGAMAIDGSGNLYVRDGGNVNRYSLTGGFEAALVTDFTASALTADPVSDDVFVAKSDPVSFAPVVVHYDSAGSVLFSFGAGQLVGPSGVGVTAGSRVYVADSGNGSVAFYDPVLAPDVTTGPATATASGAKLTGTVDPLGEATSYHFDWGTEAFYGNSTDPVDAGSGSGPVAAAASLTGLLPNQLYHYRLVASGLATNFGADATFTTDAVPPTLSTGAAEKVTRNAAKLNGVVNPQNSQTEYAFEYGPTTAYGSKAGAGTFFPPDVSDHAVSASLTNLEGGATYHYRVVADNGTGGLQVGADQTFTTLDPLATAVVETPTGVTKTSATVHGTVDNHGFPATYFFTVKATESPYVASSPVVTMTPTDGPQQVSASFADLPVGSGFEVRIVTATEGGTLVTDPLAFRTEDSVFVPLPPPVVDPNPYGCVAPRLNAYTAKARPGRTITLTGSDLGVSGVVSFGSALADADSWGANEIRVVVPEDARGSAAVKVDCARESNTIKVAIAKPAAKKKKATGKTCKRGYVKKKVKGQTRCVKRKAAPQRRR